MLNGKECKFLILMLGLSFVLLGLLNFYIGYKIIQQFRGDGWSFLGGLFISSVYILTIPANVFSYLSLKRFLEDKKSKFIVPVTLGILGALAGLILHNAVAYWLFIIVFSMVLLVASFLCSRRKKQSKF